VKANAPMNAREERSSIGADLRSGRRPTVKDIRCSIPAGLPFFEKVSPPRARLMTVPLCRRQPGDDPAPSLP
jgi:hypothetical protein